MNKLSVHHNQTDFNIWELLTRLEPAFELTLCFPCLLINIYFALRFSRIRTFNANLKIVMILTNTTTACIALIRPILHFIPENWYSVEAGRYVCAGIVYFFLYLVQCFTLIMDCKYLVVGLERQIAFANRADYESRDTAATKKMLTILILIIAMVVALHNSYRIYTTTHSTWDETLEYAFIMERSIISFFFLHFIAAICWLVGAITFHQLRIATKKSRYAGKSLSESYQIREITKIVNVMRPLILAYLSILIFCSICFCVLCYWLYFEGYHVKSARYLAVVNAEYISLNIYNMYGIIYMLWKFKALRHMFYQDVCFLMRIKIPSMIEPAYVDREFHIDDHFRVLTTHWNTHMGVTTNK